MRHGPWRTALLLSWLFALSAASAQSAGAYRIVTSSYLGSSGFDDAVVGARIQSDGTLVLAANLGADAARRLKVRSTGDAAKSGCVLRLKSDGTKVLSMARVAAAVSDLALDDKDRIYLAAGDDGLLTMTPQADRVVGRKSLKTCTRVDAGRDGHFAALAEGRIHVFSPNGAALGSAKGKAYTCDVCIDSASKTVVFCGFRNARAHDGRRTYPVQICYIHGLSYQGERKWANYDWSTDRGSDRFLNKPTNNMADTRADRCTIGRDGKLYATFQVAGGNHIFRYSPTDITRKAPIAGGDKHHQFHNSRAEHKCFFARYEPATGKYLAGQQFCGRLSSGRANAVVTKNGEIHADETGRVYLVGAAAYGLPLTLNPDGGDYTGGGFILVMSPDLRTRLLCTRPCAGKGAPHAVDARTVRGRLRAVFGGGGMPKGMFVRNAVQERAADPGDGKKDPKDAFVVLVAPK